MLPDTDRLQCNRQCHTGDADCLLYAGYRKLPKVTTLVTFGISSLWGSLLSGGRYFSREQKTLSKVDASERV